MSKQQDDFGKLFAEMFDTLPHRRKEPESDPKPKVTIEEIIRRKHSIIRFEGKMYDVTAKEMEILN